MHLARVGIGMTVVSRAATCLSFAGDVPMGHLSTTASSCPPIHCQTAIHKHLFYLHLLGTMAGKRRFFEAHGGKRTDLTLTDSNLKRIAAISTWNLTFVLLNDDRKRYTFQSA